MLPPEGQAIICFAPATAIGRTRGHRRPRPSTQTHNPPPSTAAATERPRAPSPVGSVSNRILINLRRSIGKAIAKLLAQPPAFIKHMAELAVVGASCAPARHRAERLPRVRCCCPALEPCGQSKESCVAHQLPRRSMNKVANRPSIYLLILVGRTWLSVRHFPTPAGFVAHRAPLSALRPTRHHLLAATLHAARPPNHHQTSHRRHHRRQPASPPQPKQSKQASKQPSKVSKARSRSVARQVGELANCRHSQHCTSTQRQRGARPGSSSPGNFRFSEPVFSTARTHRQLNKIKVANRRTQAMRLSLGSDQRFSPSFAPNQRTCLCV